MAPLCGWLNISKSGQSYADQCLIVGVLIEASGGPVFRLWGAFIRRKVIGG